MKMFAITNKSLLGQVFNLSFTENNASITNRILENVGLIDYEKDVLAFSLFDD